MSNEYLEQVEFDTSNPETRCPCVLLVDVSGSMGGEPIDQLNQGLVTFQQALQDDDLASVRVEVAVISFGSGVNIEQDFVTADQFQAPQLVTSGLTPMGEAIELSLDMLKARKATYKQNGVSYYRPWVFLITDGVPTDEWRTAAKRVHEEEERKGLSFFAVGVQGADINALSQIASRQPLMLKGLDFQSMFEWLSASLGSVSRSVPGEQVPLEAPSGWAEV